MRKFITLFLCAVLLFTHTTMAQNALWRAVNENEPQVVPEFRGGISPFPFKVRPNEKSKEELEAEKELAESSRVKSLKSTIASSLSGGIAITPNVATIEVRGYLMGPTGPQVLIGDRWYQEGESLQAKPMLQKNVERTLQELKRISPVHHQEARDSLMRKVKSLSVLSVNITHIAHDHLILSSRYLSQNKRIPFDKTLINK